MWRSLKNGKSLGSVPFLEPGILPRRLGASRTCSNRSLNPKFLTCNTKEFLTYFGLLGGGHKSDQKNSWRQRQKMESSNHLLEVFNGYVSEDFLKDCNTAQSQLKILALLSERVDLSSEQYKLLLRFDLESSRIDRKHFTNKVVIDEFRRFIEVNFGRIRNLKRKRSVDMSSLDNFRSSAKKMRMGRNWKKLERFIPSYQTFRQQDHNLARKTCDKDLHGNEFVNPVKFIGRAYKM